MEKGSKVLVIGAGVAGPAAAILLKRKGFDAELVERAPQFKNIGFGVTVWPNGHRILEEIGIDAGVRHAGYPAPWAEVADASGQPLGRRIDFSVFRKYGEALSIVERSYLHGMLVSKMREEGIEPRLGVSPANVIDDGERVHVEFSDGSAGAYDLVVAADGIRSDMRERLFGKHRFKFYGWSVRLFWLPPGIPFPRGTTMLTKERKTLAIYPLHGKAFATFYEYNPRRLEGADSAFSFEEFLPYLRRHGWTMEHIHALEMEALNNHQYYDHLRYVSEGPWHKGRVALIGDARHGFSPLIGMGANMALEDAWVLAEELAPAPTIAEGLRRFAARRAPRVAKVRFAARVVESWYTITSPFVRFFRNIVLLFIPKKLFSSYIEGILKRDP